MIQETELVLKHSVTNSSSLGDQLRFQREKRGLSQQEVAKALCLSVEIINALEHNHYQLLQPSVFVKGYIKNYSNFLGLSYSDPFPERISSTVRLDQKNYSKRINVLKVIGFIAVRLLNYAIVVAIIVLMFIWWHDRHKAEENALTNIKLENPR